MPPRYIFPFLCLVGLAWYLDAEQRAGQFQRLDDGFLNLLIGNSRESFQKPESESQVVLIEMKEEDRDEYATWPPPPLDWQTLIKGLQSYDPEVLLITTPLNWGRPTPDFAPAIAEALLPFPSVILGVESLLAEQETNEPAFLGDLENRIPYFREVQGNPSLTPSLSAMITAPDMAVRGSSELGLMSRRQVKGQWRLPYAVRDRDHLLPTALAQTLARYTLSPYVTGHQLHLGAGAGAHLQGGMFVPLQASGEFSVTDQDQVPTINALDLMTGDLADILSEADRNLLTKARILVVGTTTADEADNPPSLTRLYARALNHILSLPRVRMFSTLQQWGVRVLSILVALWIVKRVPRERALATGLLLLFATLVLSLLLFQAYLVWCPPTIPVLFIVAGTLLKRFLKKKDPPVPPSGVASPASA